MSLYSLLALVFLFLSSRNIRNISRQVPPPSATQQSLIYPTTRRAAYLLYQIFLQAYTIIVQATWLYFRPQQIYQDLTLGNAVVQILDPCANDLQLSLYYYVYISRVFFSFLFLFFSIILYGLSIVLCKGLLAISCIYRKKVSMQMELGLAWLWVVMMMLNHHVYTRSGMMMTCRRETHGGSLCEKCM